MMQKRYDDEFQHADPTKRYLYIQWDGIWDREKQEYISWYTIEQLCNRTNNYSNVWESKYDEMKVRNKILEKKVEYLEGLLRKHNLEGFK